MHQVAIDGDATPEDRIFDACLMVDGDNDPTKADPARSALLPQGLRFVQPNALGYRERFAAPEGRPCAPLTEWRVRWPISERNDRRPDPALFAAARHVVTRAEDEWVGKRRPGPDILCWPFNLSGGEIPGWRLIRARRAVEWNEVPSVNILMTPEHDGTDARLWLVSWTLPSRVNAHRHLALLLGRLQRGSPPQLDPPPVGDVAFGTADRHILTFARGNLVVRLRNAGSQVVRLEEAASAIDALLS